jgi:ribosome biogenesis GTPase / thiamine phosphate phosphatase
MEHSEPNAVVNLADLGWSDFFADFFRPLEPRGLTVGRIVAQHRGVCRAVFTQGEMPAEVSGRFRHAARQASEFPVIGDWVAAQIISSEGKAVIQELLPRRTKFSRTAPGDAGGEQVLAANIDDVFVVEALSAPLNLRRLERFLTLAWESGAQPAVVLTKSDLCGDIRGAVAQAEAVAAGATVYAVSSVNGRGLARVSKLVKKGRTAALLGPSGVGKSTLINQLCTEDVQFVQPVRESDHKGRHTTTEREIISLPNG